MDSGHRPTVNLIINRPSIITSIIVFASATVSIKAACKANDTNLFNWPPHDLTAINTSDFYELLVNNRVFADKSLLITEVLSAWRECKTIFITQPSGNGKTVNLDMLRRYLEFEVDPDEGYPLAQGDRPNHSLFYGGVLELGDDKRVPLAPLKVTNDRGGAGRYRGEFPVIHVSFKDVNGRNFSELLDSLKDTIVRLLNRYPYIRRVLEKEPYDKGVFDYSGPYKRDRLERSLMALARLMSGHLNRRVYVLIDEYDTPIANAYLQFGDMNFSPVRDFFWAMYVGCFKNSPYIEAGLLTGILPYRSDYFGLNNATDYDRFDDRFASYYGLTEEDVGEMTNATRLNATDEQLREWHFSGSLPDYEGNATVYYYSTASVMRHLAERAVGCSTCGRRMEEEGRRMKWFVKRAFLSDEIQPDIQRIAFGENVTFTFRRQMTFGRQSRREVLLNILTHAGYLYPMGGPVSSKDAFRCNATVPNRNVKHTYQAMMTEWLVEKLNTTASAYAAFVNLLTVCRIEDFREQLPRILSRLARYRVDDEESIEGKCFTDTGGDNLRVFYKSFFLCLLRELAQSYRIITVRQRSQFADPEKNIVLVPINDSHENALVLRYKVVLKVAGKKALNFKEAAETDLERTNIVRSDLGTHTTGISTKKVYRISIVFHKEKAALVYKHDDLI